MTPAEMTTEERPKTRWYYNVWFVLLMISPLALGPLGLPLLWKSPAFSQPVKVGLTLFTLLWTILLTVYLIKYLVPAVMNQMEQLKATLPY
ncbi:MAG: hypothetical protein HY598_00515 [Candidatus Omnitrophica bacterium]|nr:hypothetical protein [Candidatus Omnitrophota bacterium]